MRLGEVIRKWRMMSELSIRDAAAMIGISTTTMHRLESGDDVDGRTLIAVVLRSFDKPAVRSEKSIKGSPN
jgi:DNA-binding XRE family transcriptional regulator